jgi:archaeosine synthase beta-subunit
MDLPLVSPPSPSRTPIYTGTRSFLGRADLVVSFYTRKCQFGCSYCALPLRSANEPVDVEDLNAQIDGVFERHADDLAPLRQLSFGNEGSALDAARFHRESLDHLLDHVDVLPTLELLSIETRPEYVKRDVVERIRARVPHLSLDVTVGFETQDDHLRQTVLRKSISRKIMEDRIELLGELDMRLTSYVMIKPAPRMTDAEGVREAVATIEYLLDRCTRATVELVAYLTPTYIAEGSDLQRAFGREDWKPPTIQDIARVIVGGNRVGVPVYTGLWSEGFAEEEGDYRGREGYDPELRAAIAELNRTNDFAVLEPFVSALD